MMKPDHQRVAEDVGAADSPSKTGVNVLTVAAREGHPQGAPLPGLFGSQGGDQLNLLRMERLRARAPSMW
jgi:hypothetical protein